MASREEEGARAGGHGIRAGMTDIEEESAQREAHVEDGAWHELVSGPNHKCRRSVGQRVPLRGVAGALALACVALACFYSGQGESGRMSAGQEHGQRAVLMLQGAAGGLQNAPSDRLRAKHMAKVLARAFVKNLENRLILREHADDRMSASKHAAAKRVLEGASLLHASAAALSHAEHPGRPRLPPRPAAAHINSAKPNISLQTLAGAARGRSGEEVGSASAQDGAPGFEPPVGREPIAASSTGVDAGLRGEETPFIAATDEALQDLAEDAGIGDEEVHVPSAAVKEQATLRWLPFGRDELIKQAPTAQVAAHFNPASDETYKAFPDEVEPNTEQAAFRGSDAEVRQPAAGARIEPPAGFLANGTGAGGHWDSAFALQDFMDDEYVAQESVTAGPRRHRAHTDFDLQGLLPDVAIPSRDYLPTLGEDSEPYGIADDDLPVLPPVKASPPQTDYAGLVPSTWGDVNRPEDAAPEAISPQTAKDLADAGSDLKSGDVGGAAASMGAYLADLTHGDQGRRGVFGDSQVTPGDSEAEAAQIPRHPPLLAALGRLRGGGGGGERAVEVGSDQSAGES